jgi:hypothetical protein
MYSTCYSCEILIRIELFGQLVFFNNEFKNFVKICAVGAELFHVDGRT